MTDRARDKKTGTKTKPKAGKRGKNAARPDKTTAELDAEMADYWDNGSAPATAAAGTDGGANGNAQQAGAAGDDLGMDGIAVRSFGISSPCLNLND